MSNDIASILSVTEAEADRVLLDNGVTEVLQARLQDEKPSESCDLARLYLLVRMRKPFTILEFGSGHSTVVMAHALRQNWADYLEMCDNNPRYGRPYIVSLETYEKWYDNTRQKIEGAGLGDYSQIRVSDVHICEYAGQVCHLYDELPDIVPDFVYLDGPASSSVKGDISGLSFQNTDRTVMAADILRYESTLLPGFFMIVDGRTNNARFLQRRLARKYNVTYSASADVTLFELDEPPLGGKNVMGWDAYTGKR